MTGEGKKTHKDGRTENGLFKDGKLYEGEDKVEHLDGKVQINTYVNG
jgi:hypothetical protein